MFFYFDFRKKTSHQRSGKCHHHSPKQQLPLPSIDHHNHSRLQQQHQHEQQLQHVDHGNMNQHQNLFYPTPPPSSTSITPASHQYLLHPTCSSLSLGTTAQNFKQLPSSSHHQHQPHQKPQLQLQQHNINYKRPLGMLYHFQLQPLQQRQEEQHLNQHMHHHLHTISSSSSSNDNSSNYTTQTSLTTLYQTKSNNELKSLNIIDRENSILKRPLPPRPDEKSEEENEHINTGNLNDNINDDDDEENEDNIDDDDSLMPDHYIYEEPTMHESITAVVVVSAPGNSMASTYNSS